MNISNETQIANQSVKSNQNAKTSNEQTKTQNEEKNIFNEFNDWTANHSENIENYSQTLDWGDESYSKISELMEKVELIQDEDKKQAYLEKISDLQSQVDDTLSQAEQNYEKEKEEIGSSFDFSEGKDMTSNKEYHEQLYKLTEQDIEAKDTNKDGFVSYDEYLEGELQGIDDPEVIKGAKQILDDMFEKYDVDDNGNIGNDGKLSQWQLSQFYLDLDSADGEKDGKISFDSI